MGDYGRKFGQGVVLSHSEKATVSPTPWRGSDWVTDLQAVPVSPEAGTQAEPPPPPAPALRAAGHTHQDPVKPLLQLSGRGHRLLGRRGLLRGWRGGARGLLRATGCIAHGCPHPAGQAPPASEIQLSGERGARLLAWGRDEVSSGWQRRQGLGDAGARLSGAQGPGRGVPSRWPRPRSPAASCGVGGGSQAAGRRGQRAGPGAGSCGAGSPLGESLTSAVAPGERKPRFAAAATHPALGGRAGGREPAPGAGRGSAAAMARRGGGCRPCSPAAERAAGAASPAGAGGDPGKAEAAARKAAPPGPRTAGSRSLRAGGLAESMWVKGVAAGVGGGKPVNATRRHNGAALGRKGCVPLSGSRLRRWEPPFRAPQPLFLSSV